MIVARGYGLIEKVQVRRKGNGTLFSIYALDENENELLLTYAAEFRTESRSKAKDLLVKGKKIYFVGHIDENGMVILDSFRATTEKLSKFFIHSNEEEIYSYSSNGLKLLIDVKSEKFNLLQRTIRVLAQSNDENVLLRLKNTLQEKKVKLEGFFLKGFIVLTSLEKKGA